MKGNIRRNVPRKGQAMVGLLITVGIIIAAAGIYLSVKGKNPDGSTSSKTALRRSVDLAQEMALQSNLQQIQMFMGTYKDDNGGKVPASLEELKTSSKYPEELFINPVDKEPLGYDPNTGLMIVKPYEGMSPQILKMTTPSATESAPASGQADQSPPSSGAPPSSAPPAGATPGMPNIPTIPNSSGDPDAGADSQ